jgi:hypothetical protein
MDQHLNCPLIAIQVVSENLHFKVEGNLLITSDGTEIVRYFGLDRDIIVRQEVKVFRNSCFECCKYLDQIIFEPGSELERIGQAAFRDCVSLMSIDIPKSVAILDKCSFERCDELESCVMDQKSLLVTIGAKAFAKCTSLRSFDIPRLVREIGSGCFNESVHLYQLKFGSSESLKRVIGYRSLDDALYEFGVIASSSLFGIDIEDGGVELEFPEWVSISGDGEGDFQLTLVRDIQ